MRRSVAPVISRVLVLFYHDKVCVLTSIRETKTSTTLDRWYGQITWTAQVGHDGMLFRIERCLLRICQTLLLLHCWILCAVTNWPSVRYLLCQQYRAVRGRTGPATLALVDIQSNWTVLNCTRYHTVLLVTSLYAKTVVLALYLLLWRHHPKWTSHMIACIPCYTSCDFYVIFMARYFNFCR